MTRKGVHLCARVMVKSKLRHSSDICRRTFIAFDFLCIEIDSFIYFVLVTSLQNSCHEDSQKIAMILIASGSIEIMCKRNKMPSSSSGPLSPYHFGDFGPKELVVET